MRVTLTPDSRAVTRLGPDRKQVLAERRTLQQQPHQQPEDDPDHDRAGDDFENIRARNQSVMMGATEPRRCPV